MFDYKVTLGYAATIISIVSYILYFRTIFAGKTKPHAFSWLVWALLTGLAFAAQLSQKGGAGAWVTASTSIACFAIFLWAIFKGQKDFSTFDWWALASALIATLLWYFTKNPTLSVVLITIIDAVGFLPTFRKGYYKPDEESLSLYGFSAIKYVFGIFALSTFSLATWLFPASLVLTNGLFVAMIMIRRKELKKLAV